MTYDPTDLAPHQEEGSLDHLDVDALDRAQETASAGVDLGGTWDPCEGFGDLLGKPFELGARGPDAFDCLGLALEGQRRLGRELADPFEELATRDRFRDGAAPTADDWPPGWVRVGSPWERGDFLVLEPLSGHFHVALALGPHVVLHTRAPADPGAIGGIGAMMEPAHRLPILFAVRRPAMTVGRELHLGLGRLTP